MKLTPDEWELLLTIFKSFVDGYPGPLQEEAAMLLGKLHCLKGD
jgi:hypothetical protein